MGVIVVVVWVKILCVLRFPAAVGPCNTHLRGMGGGGCSSLVVGGCWCTVSVVLVESLCVSQLSTPVYGAHVIQTRGGCSSGSGSGGGDGAGGSGLLKLIYMHTPP
jgi:hypothetical protein